MTTTTHESEALAMTIALHRFAVLLSTGTPLLDPDTDGETALFATHAAAERAAAEAEAEADELGLTGLAAKVVPATELATAAPPAPRRRSAAAADLADAYPAPPERHFTVYAILRNGETLHVDDDDLASGRKYSTYETRDEADTEADKLADYAAARGFAITYTVVSQTFTTTATDWRIA